MRIDCPHCGSRDVHEFTYLGDASYRRPDPGADGALDAFVEAVHIRPNPAGMHEELWYHGAGCRSWLTVTRDTRTHDIHAVAFAGGEAAE